MLEKLKTWIYNNYFLIFSLTGLTILFYLSLNSSRFYPFFLLFLLFVNYYYLRGLEILVHTIVSPLPLLFFSVFSQLNNYLLTFIWLIYYLVFIKNKKIGWLIFLIFMTLILSFLANKYFLLWIILLTFLIFFLVIYSGFNKNFISSLLISIFVTEAFWLFYFLPFNIYLRTLLLFLFYIWILNQELI
jgi:hypothetical protein